MGAHEILVPLLKGTELACLSHTVVYMLQEHVVIKMSRMQECNNVQ